MAPLFIINPQSTRVKKKGSRLRELAKNHTANVIESLDADSFRDQFAAAIKKGAPHIFIEGGDGTLQNVFTEYFKLLPEGIKPARFTIVPGGTTNQVAGNIGAKKLTAAHFAKLIKGETETIHTIPLLAVKIDDQPEQHGFLFSSGAVPMATEYYTDHIRGSGLTGTAAVFATVSAALGRNKDNEQKMMKPSPVKLLVASSREEVRLDEEHLGTMATTLPGFYMGLDPFWAKGEAPLRLTYLRGDQSKLVRLIMSVAFKQFEKLSGMEGVESWRADFIEMEYDGPTVLDGEALPRAEKSIALKATQPITFLA